MIVFSHVVVSCVVSFGLSQNCENLLNADDEVHIERANALGLVLMTADHDFLRLIHERPGGHPGLFFILPSTAVGAAIRTIALAAEVLEPTDMENWIEWIP